MTRIVVAGCGIAGFDVVRRLAAQTEAEITAVNQTNHLTFYPSIHDVAAGKRDLADVSINLATYFNQDQYQDVEFIRGTVTHVNPEKQLLETHGETIPYDILVLALGSQVNFFGVTPEKDIHTILYRDEIEKMQASIPRLCRHRDTANIAVVGGGATGVEAAAILAHELKQCPADITIQLLEAGDTILTQISENGRRKAKNRLTRLGVDIITEAQVTDITQEDTVILKNGNELVADEVVWAAGVKAADTISKLPFPTTDTGEIPVTNTFHVENHEHVYAVGDCISLPNQNKIKRAYYATKEAVHAADNITHRLNQEEETPYRQEPDPPFILQMGGRKALYTHKNRAWLGSIPWIMEKLGVEKRYFWTRQLL